MPEPLYRIAINCRHEIDAEKVVLYFNPNKPGHNALNQLAGRLDAALASYISEERSRAQDAVVRGLKMAEALRAILDVVEGKVVTENESAAMNVICAIADDTLEEAAK